MTSHKMTRRRAYKSALLPDLVGLEDALVILDISKTNLRRWMEPGSGPRMGFPGHGPDRTYMIEPKWLDQAERRRPVWRVDDLERFKAEYPRLRAKAGEAKASAASNGAAAKRGRKRKRSGVAAAKAARAAKAAASMD